MSKKKKILLIVLAVVLVAGGICWRILPDRLTSGTLKLSEDISLTHRLAAGKRGFPKLKDTTPKPMLTLLPNNIIWR